MKAKLLALIVLLTVAMLLGAAQPQGRAQTLISAPPGNVDPPQGYPAAVVYPGVTLPAQKAARPLYDARRFLLDAAEIIED